MQPFFSALTHASILFYSRVLLDGLRLDGCHGIAGFVRRNAVGCRDGVRAPGFAATQAGRQCCTHYCEKQEGEPVAGATA